MKKQLIQTLLGQISVAIEERGTEHPIVFMHGVFLDKTLWKDFDSNLTGRTHIYIDMPAHGVSSNVGHDWSIDDCVAMLTRVLDELNVRRCSVIGHSWGSMTALRAATSFPSRFASLGLFNMPFKRTTGIRRLGFKLQKTMVAFPRFYARQAAKSLYTESILRTRPDLSEMMQERLSVRPPKELSRVIDAVILNPADTEHLLNDLRVPALAVVGESDYVGIPSKTKTVTVQGGHFSPHEAPSESRQAIKRVVEIAVNST